jgi:subtilisin family serine protease/chitodextrinase
MNYFKFFSFFLISIFIATAMNAQERKVNEDGFYEGVVRIKIDRSAAKDFDALFVNDKGGFKNKLEKTKSSSHLTLGISEFDKLNEKFSAVSYKRVFRYAKKFEARHREYGLHLWYEIEFTSKSSVDETVKSFAQIRSVNISEPVVKMSLVDVSSKKSLSGTPNDNRYSEQWHYNNTGQTNGTADADIDLPEAWEIQTGSNQVIVAIEDQGVDFDHPDLAGNMWRNPGETPGNGIDDDNNGYVDDYYGYNFGDDQGTITPGDHGSHVAGTVAAETNNGTGVAGVAGGTGNNDGVRIMSCEVFGTSNQGGFDEAFVYAADMGAHISQNSWGGGGESQAINDAIDYFIANGGGAGSPMTGGVVIIAAGNSNTNSGTSIWPAAYENAIAVAATNHEDKKSYYSNYGTWVDISAPGGETNVNSEGVLSCWDGGTYGFYQGTSMACPHVSGVAALIVSEYAGNITPSEVRNRLLTYVDDIEANNPSYTGQLGSGRLNAYAALTGSTPAPPPVTFCTSSGSNYSDEWIAGVSIGSFTNTSAAAGYTDFTSQTVELAAGQTYNVTLTPGFSGTSYSEYWKIWIDYNNDTTFTADELAFDAGALSKTEVTGNISIPSGASGTVRMRVSMKYNGAQTSCETFSYGEVEDYHVQFGGSTPDTEAPAAPSNLSASNVTKTSADLSWSASSDNVGVTGYKVYQDGTLKANVSGTSTTISGLSQGTSYNFYVKAEDAAGNLSSASNTVNVTTDADDTQAPTAPANLAASNITTSSLDLNWDASSDNTGVTGYDIYQGGSLINTVSGTSASVSGLTANTAYSFYVKAKDAAGNISAASNTVNVSTLDDSSGDCFVSAVTLDLTFDNYPAETSWSLTDGSGNTIASGSGYSTKGGSVSENFDLSDGDYSFTINDSYGDGICCSYGNGSYTLTDGNGNVIVTGGDFGSSENTPFCISGSGDTPGDGGAMPEGYCASQGNNSSYEWIDLVQLGSINNSTGNNGGYADFTNLSTDLTIGNQYTVNFSAGFSGSSYTEYYHVFIDFNRDGDFEDAGEEAVTGSSSSNGTLSGTFTVPSGASEGTTRMRVSMKYNAAATPCESFTYGEVEDYAVNLTTASTTFFSMTNFAEEIGNETSSFILYPNPANDKVQITMPQNSNAKVSVYNISGSLVRHININADESIDVSSLASGVYTVKINDGRKLTSKRLIIQ